MSESVRIDVGEAVLFENLLSHAVILVGLMGSPLSCVKTYPVLCHLSPFMSCNCVCDALKCRSNAVVSTGILTNLDVPVLVVVS